MKICDRCGKPAEQSFSDASICFNQYHGCSYRYMPLHKIVTPDRGIDLCGGCLESLKTLMVEFFKPLPKCVGKEAK